MAGFQPKSKRQNKEKRRSIPPQELAQGGLIEGAGTGTSDSIKAAIPDNAFIMPADSTEQLGPENLKAMGFQANVSDGEFLIPPEQVHAIGAEVLGQMKDETHTPVGGFQPKDGELYFADGGLNDEAMRRNQMRPALPSPEQFEASRSGYNYAGADSARTGVNNTFMLPNQSSQQSDHMRAKKDALIEKHSKGQSSTAHNTSPKGNYTYADQARANAKADTASWQADQAKQDARWSEIAAEKNAGLKTVQPQGSIKGITKAASKRAVPAISAAVDAKDMYDISKAAYNGEASGLDVATQGAELLGKGATTALGAKAGMTIGAFGGPAAPITVPLGGFLGGLSGYFGGDQLIRKGRDFIGADTRSPIEQLKGEDAGQDNADTLSEVGASAGGAVLGGGAGRLAGKVLDAGWGLLRKGKYKGNNAEKWLTGGGALSGAVGANIIASDTNQQLAEQREQQAAQENENQVVGGNSAGVNVSIDGGQQDGRARPLDNDVKREIITNPDGTTTTSFSGNNIREGFTVNGEQYTPKNPITYVDPQFFNGPTGVQAGGFNPQQAQQSQQGPTSIIIGQDAARQSNVREARQLAKQAATARGITANQRRSMMEAANMMLGINNNQDKLAADQQALASSERVAGVQSAAGNRNAATNEQELALKKQMFQERNALMDAFEQEKNPERKAMLQARLRMLSSGSGSQQQKASDRYMVVKGGQTISDDGQIVNQPDSILDGVNQRFLQMPDSGGFDPSMYHQVQDANGNTRLVLKSEFQPK